MITSYLGSNQPTTQSKPDPDQKTEQNLKSFFSGPKTTQSANPFEQFKPWIEK